MNQTAQTLASHGRYGDSMLVHMSPQEVGGLQALARNNGTSLTVNPNTGLPEAFNLSRLLPMIAGAGLTAISGGTLSPLTVGLMTGGLGALATGSLREGLMMGLGAAGGAGMAGSMANLAAPAAAATTPVIPAAVTPAALPQAAAALPQAAAAPSLSFGDLAPATTSAAPATSVAASPVSAGFATAPPGTLGSGTFDPIGGIASLPTQTSGIGLTAPSELVGTTAPNPFTDRLSAGFKQSVSSPEAFGKYLSDNKMNLAMSTAPALFGTPEEQELAKQDAYIRPYTLDVENLSGRPVSPTGIEDERLRYRYIAGTPYRAAKGGIIAFADGGNTTDGQEVGSSPVPTVSPEIAKVYESIARVQGMAGLPQLQVPAFAPSQPSPVIGIANQPVSSRERNYGIAMPKAESSETYSAAEAKKIADAAAPAYSSNFDNSYSYGYAKGGETKEVRKKIDRMEDPYKFADYRSGRGLYEAAQQNFAGGGLSNVPRFLSGGGDGMSDSIPATINDRQPARLADGEFVIPADVVSHLGNGSSKAGAKQLYAMMDRVRNKRTGKKKQAPAVNPKKMMPV